MGATPFSLDHAPLIGAPEPLGDDLEVVTAPNASPMTFTGTRSYILGERDVALIDPGPEDAAHHGALMSALRGRRVSAIVVTHAHLDHTPLARRISRETGAPIYGCDPQTAQGAPQERDLGALAGGEGIDQKAYVDVALKDGDRISGPGWTLEALHTPGHLNDHMCFSSGSGLFSGDHVMGWASTMISPPEGSVGAFMASLKTLLKRPEQRYFPGHGPALEHGPEIAAHLLEHRTARSAQIRRALEGGALTIAEITGTVYPDLDRRLLGAAGRNVLAHLLDLMDQGAVSAPEPFSTESRFALTP